MHWAGFESDSDEVASDHDGRDAAAVEAMQAAAAGLCSSYEYVVGCAVGDLRGALQRATIGTTVNGPRT